ncbi:MAG TPA: hypothetical protein VFF78_03870 [Anaerolineaceae bacterium]|nr:hypothetical protein [Anaerolineaceae bacterium]
MSDIDVISAVCSGIQEIGIQVAGINTSYSLPPDTLETSSLPALYPLTGQARHDNDALGRGMVMVVRNYSVQVALQAIAQGVSTEIEQQCREMINSVCLAFRKHPMLNGTPGVLKSIIISDSGPAILTEWGGKYIGFEIRLEVSTAEPADYEE